MLPLRIENDMLVRKDTIFYINLKIPHFVVDYSDTSSIQLYKTRILRYTPDDMTVYVRRIPSC